MMSALGKIVFFAGLLFAVLAGFFSTVVEPAAGQTVPPCIVSNIIAWLAVGGCGVLAGLLNITNKETQVAFFSLIGIVVAFTAILAQPFNPFWLSNTVFWVRVFTAHILLVIATFHLFRTFATS